MPVWIMPIQVVLQSNALLSHPSLVAQWLERLHGKQKVLGLLSGSYLSLLRAFMQLPKHTVPSSSITFCLSSSQEFRSACSLEDSFMVKNYFGFGTLDSGHQTSDSGLSKKSLKVQCKC